jgi:hypothetical protein
MNDGTGRGPAIYVIGGYDVESATPIGTVQRYYPQTGTVEALPPADDWSVGVEGWQISPGGTAVVNEIIYVFGGWESVAAPYFYNGTWAFDPTQVSGSRWTNLGVTINPARSYIQVAVIGTNIYAMGGHFQYVGDLVPTTVVEVLDTTNIAGGWTTVAPMPVASAEGQGFGFDNTMNLDPSWVNKAYVVGGGDWPSNTAEVMEYDVGTNTWDQFFPDLNQARRNHAGAFVPTSTADPNDGLPGMWVFGGNIGYDAPPFGDAEFYPMAKAQAVIPVFIDIKPQSCPNPLNLRSKGVVPVAILGTDELDVQQIDPTTIMLSCEDVEVGIVPLRWAYEDVATPFEGQLCDCHTLGPDGYLDLTLKFSTTELASLIEELGFVKGETILLSLTGNLLEEFDGSAISGDDCMRLQKLQGRK